MSTPQHTFARVPSVSHPRSIFNRSRTHKTTFNSGYIIPVYCDEVLPGDSLNFSISAFLRLATPLHPYMDNLYLDWQAWFVPNRLVWNNWEKFNGQQDDPDDSTDFLVPVSTFPAGGYAINSLQDYYGLPVLVAGGVHTTLPIRGYNLIYNTWYRDQNLQDSIPVNKGDGPDTVTDYVIRRRGKRHDYFTSSLPFAQKGESVSIPLGTKAPVTGLGKYNQTFANGPENVYETGGTGPVTYASGATSYIAGSPSANLLYMRQDPDNPGFPGIYADLTEAADVTINALRTSVAMQQFLELDARGGTRYTEIIRAHFGVISPDARLQRPEFLGGGTSYVNVTPVVQQSETTVDSPQGNLAGFGTASMRRDGFSKSFVEHGYVHVFISARADLTYQQGLNRMWSRRNREEFFWPSFANIGEQPVRNKEIYYQGTAGGSADEGIFGYQEPYGDYRYGQNQISGEFRSVAPQSLDTWHLAQEFASLPVLGPTFIVENPPVERVIAVTDEIQFIGDFQFNVRSARPMPVFGVPGLTRL